MAMAVTQLQRVGVARRAAPRGAAPRGAASRGAERRPSPRVVRNRRRALLGVVLVVLAAWLLGMVPARSAAGTPAQAPVVVVVRPGDTVWELARPLTPAGESPLAYVQEVIAANGVDGTALQPGTVLLLPVR